LITSQNSSSQFWKSERMITEDPLILAEFTDEEARQFVETVLDITDDCGITDLVKMFNHYPLALCQAVVYIRDKIEKHEKLGYSFTVNDYIIEEFKKTQTPSKKHSDTVLNAMKLALDNEKSWKILDITSYFDSMNIPIKLFMKEIASGDLEEMSKVTSELEKYSIVRLNRGMLNVHAFVQTFRRDLLAQEDGKEAATLRQALNMLNEHKSTPKEMDEIITHIISVWNHACAYDKLI
jgi:hypothetical protein